MRILQGRNGVAETAMMLHRIGLVVGMDGNVSARCGDGCWITPSQCHKGLLGPEDIVMIDRYGEVKEGEGKPSSEWRLHMALYRTHPRCGAVIHAHPPWTLALSLSQYEFTPWLLTEGELMLKEIVMLPRLSPGSEELAVDVGRAGNRSRVIVLDGHGAVTWGEDLVEALTLMECLEHCSKVTLLAKGIGGGG